MSQKNKVITSFKDMDEDNQDDNSVFMSHNRSRNFSQDEVEALVELVTIHKDVILNKCTNTASNRAKDQAWAKICTEINKRGFKYKRTPDNLKTKWLNLKRLAKKVTENIIDVESTNLNGALTQIVMMINENEPNVSLASAPMDGNENSTSASMTEVPQEESFQAMNDMEEENVSNMSHHSDDNANDQSDESEEAEADIVVPKKRGRVRTLNFSPAECSLLIRCVRDERDNILFRGKGCSMKAVQIQNRAWARITKRYNKLSPQQRTNKMLRTKFYNMKRLANRVQFRNFFFKNHGERSFARKNHQEDEGVDEKFGAHSVKVKREFKTEPMPDMGSDRDSDGDNEEFPEVPVEFPEKHEDSSDPLCMVLNGDSGMESISHFGSYTHENKDVVKLKLKLLKYQLETAKLERQRIKEDLEAQNAERQSKAIETSLRLRKARLDAVASETQLPSNHPALQYTEQEKLAQQYLLQFEHT